MPRRGLIEASTSEHMPPPPREKVEELKRTYRGRG